MFCVSKELKIHQGIERFELSTLVLSFDCIQDRCSPTAVQMLIHLGLEFLLFGIMGFAYSKLTTYSRF